MAIHTPYSIVIRQQLCVTICFFVMPKITHEMERETLFIFCGCYTYGFRRYGWICAGDVGGFDKRTEYADKELGQRTNARWNLFDDLDNDEIKDFVSPSLQRLICHTKINEDVSSVIL